MAQNLEIKARYEDLALARQKIQQLNADFMAREEQTDIFYRVAKGRLKMRIINGEKAVVIPYLREDANNARLSAYTLLPVNEIHKTEELLAHILGVTAVVRKKREIYLYQNVRIHLDDVQHLGCFMEFEAVQEASSAKQNDRQKVTFLMEHFGINQADVVAVAYVDLLHKQNTEPFSAG